MKLRVTPAERGPFDFEMEEGSIVVGRSSTADLSLADPFASRHHARLTRRGDSLQVGDLGARNGTFLNDDRIVGVVEVRPGDRIRIAGSYILRPDEGVSISDTMTRGTLGTAEICDATFVRPAAEILGEESSGAFGVHGGEALEKYVERLKTLRGIHRAFSRVTSRTDLLQTALDWAFKLFAPQQGAIYLRASDGELRRAESRPTNAASDIPLPEAMVVQVQQGGLAVSAKVDPPRLGHSASPSPLSLMAVPMLDAEECVGMMVLSRDRPWPFPREQLDLLVELAGEAALELRKISLAEEAQQARLLERELDLARGIQLGILPRELPSFEGYSFESRNIPSRGVSGDFYKSTPRRSGEECVLFIGDVSGKGFSAALLTASVEALSAVMIEAGDAPDEICSKLSRQLSERTLARSFVTAFVAALDRQSGRLTYTSAGHNTVLLVRPGGSVEKLESTGLPLAAMRGKTYELREVLMGAGATLLLYTDGITEPMNRDNEEYGLERLEACLVRHHEAALPEILEAIETDLDDFVGDMPYEDDRTILLVRRSQL